MKELDFITLYYSIDKTFISNIIPDLNPVTRVCGIDETAGYGTVFTAIGTRFDADYAQSEAFKWTETYETDLHALDKVKVAEAMRYVRMDTINKDKLNEEYALLVDEVRGRDNLYGNKRMQEVDNSEAELVFLPSPATLIEPDAEKRFAKIAEAADLSYAVKTDFNDCGYLMLELGLFAELEELTKELEPVIKEHEYVVTDDAYVLDALLVQFPEQAEKIYFLDEFVAGKASDLFNKLSGKVAYHNSGVIYRLYPTRIVDYKEVTDAELVKPWRSGFDVTDSGIAGGLGFFEKDVQEAVAARRYRDLADLEADIIFTPCSAEAFGLSTAGEIKSLLEVLTD